MIALLMRHNKENVECVTQKAVQTSRQVGRAVPSAPQWASADFGTGALGTARPARSPWSPSCGLSRNSLRFAAFLSIVLLFAAPLARGADPILPAERLLATARPLVIGHRGFNVLAPENTLPSFQFAVAAGADLVELDYHQSKDGVPIVIHDGELDRTTDAVQRWGARKIRVDSKTAAELRALDAGRWFDAKFAGTRLPLLTEALDVIQTNGGVTLIEHKAGPAAQCATLLRERDLVNRVIVQSFDWAFLRAFHQQVPAQVLGALGPPGTRQGKKLTDAEKELSPEWIREAQQTGAGVIGWNKLVNRAAVDYAHQQKLKVWVYTINDPAQARDLLSMGVDGIITDNTSLIWRAIALR